MKRVFFILVFFQVGIFCAQKAEHLRLSNFRIAVLNDTIRETSGLSLINGKLLTLNDSGNTSEIFEIDKKNGKLLKVYPTDLINKDWEALTNDGENLYIGDFGNNAGTRKDLKIFKIPFQNNQLQKDSVHTISFYYPEQKDFTPKNINNDFDAEAMIFLNGKIHLFTKEWVSKSVSHYIIDPEIDAVQPALKIETYPTGFVVTDAAFFSGKLYLVGYTKGTQVYLMVFDEEQPGIFFKGKQKKYRLGSAFSVSQIEGVSVDENGIYISGEAFKTPLGTQKQTLYFVPRDHIDH